MNLMKALLVFSGMMCAMGGIFMWFGLPMDVPALVMFCKVYAIALPIVGGYVYFYGIPRDKNKNKDVAPEVVKK